MSQGVRVPSSIEGRLYQVLPFPNQPAEAQIIDTGYFQPEVISALNLAAPDQFTRFNMLYELGSQNPQERLEWAQRVHALAAIMSPLPSASD